MPERILIVDDDLADLLREHLPAIAHELKQRGPTSWRAACTKKEAAEALRISERTLERMVKAGEVRVTRLGGRIVFARSEIERVAQPTPVEVSP